MESTGRRSRTGKRFDVNGDVTVLIIVLLCRGSNRPLNEWYGVQVDYQGFVTKLILRSNYLAGKFCSHFD
jgi:hypothetical protein